ncbi:hypothetical protein BC938DRAFT_480352 [Jimgerdemannia flammicorona]|uniref:SET domain-containing protein n=1 Tax=Jimgerdemannia flammicorona TaxID=994334 RepID=A0A433QIP6_9FUNG|nr:hypothetical protein BC938DRAFT_480352 [Jimgerdemannia flammicorona]
MPRTPSHPGLLRVVSSETGNFTSKAVSTRAFAQGGTITRLEGLTPGPKRYSTVQISRHEHVELNSDLLYLNHSCVPNVSVDVEKMLVVALKDIIEGDELTFFYPATEWEIGITINVKPFVPLYRQPDCIKNVKGASALPSSVLMKYPLSKHIRELLEERDRLERDRLERGMRRFSLEELCLAPRLLRDPVRCYPGNENSS